MKLPSVIVGLGARLFTWNRAVVEWWARHVKVTAHAGTPWTPLRKEPGAYAVALVTTAGVHLASDAPFDMGDRRGDPSFREIPSDASASGLLVTHDHYDHRDADRDVNVVFPVDRLRELAGHGEIGRTAPLHYSFMGHVTGPHVATLRDATSREVARRLRAAGVDIALLSPARGWCHQSVGLVQRAIEEAGIATVSVTMLPAVTRKVGVPRAVYAAFPLGHPFGFPGEAFRQREILSRMLLGAAAIREPGTIVDLGYGDPGEPPDGSR